MRKRDVMAMCQNCGKPCQGFVCQPCRLRKTSKRIEPPQTEAEIEALIAEQMKCLPDWWWDERADGYEV